jgi:phosphoribosylamine--glycine ligase
VKILVIGSGAREHALCWKIAQSPRVTKLFCAPGNAGTAQVAESVPIRAEDIDALARFARANEIDLTVVGPEDPLARGIVDAFQAAGLRAFGPTRAAARLEASKVFCKELLARHGIPMGDFAVFEESQAALDYLRASELPIVVKADGLAKGKGVTVAATRDEAEAAVRAAMVERVFGDAGGRVVIEECLQGPEVSLMAFADGKTAVAMEPVQDYKRVHDGDQGPNTGGMGCYSPVPLIGPEMVDEAMERVLRPTIAALAEEGAPYVGVLYAGLMLTDDGLKVLEFNGRFGDPETQAIVPRLETDLVDLLEACVEGRLAGAGAAWSPKKSVCVVMASGGYPGDYETGMPIRGLERAARLPETVVFHAGTRRTAEGVVTAGGRVLGVTALGETFREAVDRAYAGAREIEFEGSHYRRDIAQRAVEQEERCGCKTR